MMQIPLDAIPNQSLSVRLDGRRYEITVQATAGVMSATIIRDGVTLVQGQRCSAGTALLPFLHLEDSDGNFAFLTDDGEYPDYRKFDSTHQLMYFGGAELVEIRSGADG
ncbi:hypothetical protein LMG10661_03660 [Ralstonia syzygii subsp. syzygii]|nr:hypothetical protein LMG10661_03660 [Ralstonia syzygii subsp. syzygii]